MKRVIIDYKKLTPEILMQLTQKFPDGYGDDDIIVFNNHHNETIEAVEVESDDTIYLVKIGSKLQYSMINFDSDTMEVEVEDVAISIPDEDDTADLDENITAIDLEDEVDTDD
ncbi:MAG: hypothetical protein KJO41_10885 [Bacteroidia bacterium]|nr:hypothetical protein [Bacteroidia bacterium]NND26512.1 hypothetical protein [Flavobacteriaceae bacterium]MBT8279499.1 hypothetical protein [Bacteroidia bacterium]NNK59455.1 hypothetical protein [Flavobacteriaceae bacterium]NNL32735.1 hypothetical protein [Flavobacteriaceae bacterium]